MLLLIHSLAFDNSALSGGSEWINSNISNKIYFDRIIFLKAKHYCSQCCRCSGGCNQRKGREDLIVAGGLILVEIMKQCKDELIVSDEGLLEGIILEKVLSAKC